MGQYDLLGALEVELDYNDLIRDILTYVVESEGPTYTKLFFRNGPTGLYPI